MLSTQAAEKFWHEWGNENGVDAHEILKMSHGSRTIDVLQLFKPELATLEYAAEVEGEIPVKYASYAVPVPGVHALRDALPPSQWAIVTSGTNLTASRWLQNFLQFDPPDVFITAESVDKGKPDPAGYKLAAERLNLSTFLVFEDAPAGIAAGKAAGATVIGMATTYDAETVKKAGADIVIEDLTHVKVQGWDAETRKLSLLFEDCLF
ncbi:glycerol-1-phosphate phosphohydrolase 1 [Trichomonascus vanleenenianus]|uniref:glycerol-1-phosphate phosphohydrolase 1 n=1 Tax=Trichomonascus vanleenenianus TaxID=2268995 RepID=UPI003ECB2B9F